MKSKIVLAITIFISFIIQCTMLDHIAIGSIKPNLLVILCVSMGLMRGKKSGLWTGFFCGILIDLFYGSIFGVYALIYMYIGYLSGYACKIYFDDHIKVPMIMVSIADLFYGVAVYVLIFLLRGRMAIESYFFRIILPEIFYSVLLTFVVYRVYHFINNRFMTSKKKERKSIWVLK